MKENHAICGHLAFVSYKDRQTKLASSLPHIHSFTLMASDKTRRRSRRTDLLSHFDPFARLRHQGCGHGSAAHTHIHTHTDRHISKANKILAMVFMVVLSRSILKIYTFISRGRFTQLHLLADAYRFPIFSFCFNAFHSPPEEVKKKKRNGRNK